MISPQQALSATTSAPSGEVLVCCAALDVREPAASRDAALLSPDERERAARLVFPLHRARWIASRALLRRLLAARLGAEPQALRFAYGPSGKPSLAHAAAALGFSLSHSGAWAALAIADVVDVGLDLEVVRPARDLEGVAARFFSAQENADLAALPGPARLRAFYECWTRKEAFLKATGEGLTRPLDGFSVTLGPGVPPRLRETRPDPGERDRWTLLALEPAPGVLAAVALPRGAWRVRAVDAPAEGRP